MAERLEAYSKGKVVDETEEQPLRNRFERHVRGAKMPYQGRSSNYKDGGGKGKEKENETLISKDDLRALLREELQQVSQRIDKLEKERGEVSPVDGTRRSGGQRRACFHRNEEGHFAYSCPKRNRREDDGQYEHRNNWRGQWRERKDLQQVRPRLPTMATICYRCKQPGHFARDCVSAGERQGYGDNGEESAKLVGASSATKGLIPAYLELRCNGRIVDCLLDTGCEKSIMPARLVPKKWIEPTNAQVLLPTEQELEFLGRLLLYFG